MIWPAPADDGQERLMGGQERPRGPGEARGDQERPGEATSGQERPGEAQGKPGEARRGRERSR